MNVQQGRLGSADTTKNMASYYNDTVATKVEEVDRNIHNGTQFVRLVLQRPQPTTARGAATGSPDTQVEVVGWIDSATTAIGPITPADLIIVGFGRSVSTTQIKIFTTSIIDTVTDNWTVSTSLNNLDAEYTDSNFEAPIVSVDQAIDGSNFVYTVVFTAPPIDTTGEGLPWWRIDHTLSAAFTNVSEVQPVNNTASNVPQIPTISYFDTDGTFASSFTFEKSNILDACYDLPNTRFYTIRFNTDNVGTTSINLGDDFSEAEAGTAATSNNFNPARWTESTANPQFLRNIGSEILTHNVALGNGQLETTYTVANTIRAAITVTPDPVISDNKWFTVRALDANNNTVMSEGVGYKSLPTATGVWFTSAMVNLIDGTAACDLREGRPLWHNSQDGSDEFTIAFTGGSTWTVSGTLTGALTDASTGVLYDESVDADTPLEFLVSCTASPTPGEQFTFNLVTTSGHKFPETVGEIGFHRLSTTWSGLQSTFSPAATVTTDAVSVELFGNTAGSVNLSADDFTISGTATFPQIAVFTVEKTDNEGDVDGTPLIESFDIIGDPSLSYNDFLDGRVQIATTQSGTGGGFVYIKVNNELYKYPNSIALGTETGSSATLQTTDQIPKDGTSSFNWTQESSIGGNGFLTYLEYEQPLDILHNKTIDKDTLQNTTVSVSKEVLLDISDYSTEPYKVFYDQNDLDTLYYIDVGTNLRAFNQDDRISAFMAVNAQDTTMPAGTAQSTLVNADVINAWGEALDGKDVTFQVTAGDGAVTPSTDTTISGGRATTQFVVGATVGVSTITATVTEN